MNILIGKVVEVINPNDRYITATSIHGHGTFAGKLLFSPHNIEKDDYVLIISPHSGMYHDVFFIPFSDKTEHTLNKIKIHYTPESYIEIMEDALRIIHKKSQIELTENQITITHDDKSTITMDKDYVKTEGDKLHIICGQETYVPGNPDQSQSTSTGGFSKILYCPFTGLPHNTDTLKS